jgi:hypothetical protein
MPGAERRILRERATRPGAHLCAGTAELLHSIPAAALLTCVTAHWALADETVIRMTVVAEVEELKLRLENLSGMIPENHPGKIALQGWFTALVAQAHLILIVFNLEAILEAKTGSDVGEEVGLTLRMLAPLREAAAAAEHLALSL